MLASEQSDLVVVTYAQPAKGAAFFPDSRLGDTRQALGLIARDVEQLQGNYYAYWVFADDDVAFVQGGPREFESFLHSWEPAVAVPANRAHHARFAEWFDLGIEEA